MSIFDKAKQKAEELAGMVKDKLDGDDKTPETTDAGSSAAESRASATEDGDPPTAVSSPDAVTPADVADSVSDPDLPHPEPPAER